MPTGQAPLRLDGIFHEGDFSLVSADGCIFRVEAAEVEAKESDLRSAIQTCRNVPDNPASITFDQPASVLQPFLSALLDDRAPSPATVPIESFSLLLSFTLSLHATRVIALLRPVLPLYLKPKRADPYYIFMAATRLSDWSTAAKALGKHSKDYIWYRDHSPSTSASDRALGCRPGTFDVDPSGLPYHFWMEIPKKVSWALVRACAERKSWKERGERFEVLMGLIQARDKAWPKFAAMENEESASAYQDSHIPAAGPTDLHDPSSSSARLDPPPASNSSTQRKRTSPSPSPHVDQHSNPEAIASRPLLSGKTLPGSSLPLGCVTPPPRRAASLFLPFSSKGSLFSPTSGIEDLDDSN